MSPDILIQHFGGVTATAKAFGVKPPSVSEWRKRGQVPLGRQYQALALTSGKLKPDKPEGTQ